MDNNEAWLDELMADHVPCVIAVPSTEKRRQWRTAGGHRVRVCPADYADVNCANCMLCHTRPEDMAIAFPAHGTKGSIKKADLVLIKS